MREFTVPPLAAAPSGRRSGRRRLRPCRGGPAPDRARPQGRRGPVAGRDRGRSSATRCSPSPRGCSRRASGSATGSPSCPVPATSGRSSTSRCGRSAPSPCRSIPPPRPSRSCWMLHDAEVVGRHGRARGPRDDDRLGHRPAAAAAPAVAAGRRRGERARRRPGAHIDDEVVHRHRRAVTPDSIGDVIYTSGTTGRPKGCVITHANFMFEADTMVAPLGAGVPLQAGRRGGDAALPAARPRLRPDGGGRRDPRPGEAGPPAGAVGDGAAAGPRVVPADVHPRGAVHLREGLQRARGARPRRRARPGRSTRPSRSR